MMSSGIFKKDGRALFLDDGELREIPRNKKITFFLYEFFKNPTIKNFGLFVGVGVIAGLIVGYSTSSQITFAILGTVLGAVFGSLALIATASVNHEMFSLAKYDTKDSIVNVGKITGIIEYLTTEEIFEYHDSVIQWRGLKDKIAHANVLLNKTNSDSPIYEDLKKKKESLQEEREKASDYINVLWEKFESKKKAKEDQEVLDFLNVA